MAETTAREIGVVSLGEALELTALIAKHDRDRGRRYAVRWLQRWLAGAGATLDDVALVVAALGALGGPSHGDALDHLARRGDARVTREGGKGERRADRADDVN